MNRDFIERWVAFRRDLHRHPELSFQEKRTAEQIEKALAELGINSRRVAGTGVVAEIPSAAGGFEGPMVALRADTDALPIHEETGLEYASVNDGVMHACGHDGHTAMVLGAAEMLAKDGNLPAPVRLVFQPAEEIVDFRNNVIYNWGFNSSYGGEAGNQNVVANYYKYGPASAPRKLLVSTTSVSPSHRPAE